MNDSDRTSAKSAAKPTVSVKSVAIPAEHGGWGFLIEPMVLGMIVAPSWAGLGICVLAAAVFLLHQPVKIVVKDRAKGRVYARTQLAQRFILIYGVIAAAALIFTLATAQGAFWLPFLIALPTMALQLLYEFRNEGRSLGAEVFGALALAATAPAVILATGDDLALAALTWLLIGLRAVPSILYVRTRLRLIRGKTKDILFPIAAHGSAVVLGGLLWLCGQTTALVILPTVILFARALQGLTTSRAVPARVIGMQEVVLGLTHAVLCALAV